MKFYTSLLYIFLLGIIQSGTLICKGLAFDGFDDFAIIADCPGFHADNIMIKGEITLNSDSSRKSGKNSTRQFIIFKKNSLENFNEAFAVYYNSADSSLWATFSSKDGIQTNITSGNAKVEPDKPFKFEITVSYGQITMVSDGNKKTFCKLKGKLDYANGPVYLGGRYSHPADPGEYEGKFNGEISELEIINLDETDNLNLVAHSSVVDLDFNQFDGSNIPDKSGFNNNALFFKGTDKSADNSSADKFSLNIYPNPVGRTGNIKFNNLTEGNVTLDILDITGKVIKRFNYGSKPKGINDLTFTTDGITDGQYLAILECKEQSQKQVFVLSK